MARNVAIGIQDFEQLITNDYFYIDKTDFIREWWGSGDSHIDRQTAEIWKNAEYEHAGEILFCGVCGQREVV